MDPKDSADYPLAGLKILDFSRVLAGPYAGRMLSDLGADVLKVEAPEGDMTRRIGKKTGGLSGYFIQQNIGKRSLCIDLKAEGAKEVVFALVSAADIVIENYRPGVMERLGFGWSALSEVRPDLVMLSISGFGQEGPEKHRPAYAPMLHMEAGLTHRQSLIGGGKPVDFTLSLADTLSSLHGLVGLLAALHHARATGKGQHVDIGMIDVIHATDDFANYVLDEKWSPETQRQFGEIWEAPDNAKIGIAGPVKALWKVFDLSDSAAGDDGEPIDRQRGIIASYLLSFDSFDALTGYLDDKGLVWGKVRTFGEDAYSQPSVVARDIIVDVDDGLGGKRRTVQSPYKFSNARSGISPTTKSARLGENNLDALSDWLGWDQDALDAQIAAGVILDPTSGDCG